MKKNLKKRIKAGIMAGCFSLGVFLAPQALPVTAPVAEAAVNPIAVLNPIFTGAMMHDLYLKMYIANGNLPEIQEKHLKENMGKAGQCLDVRANTVVSDVMQKLIDNGEYAMKATSLPFRWRVNNDKSFNASCYYSDYVTVNIGCINALHYNHDELAAVLSHEMIHGLCQHTANTAADVAGTNAALNLFLEGRADWINQVAVILERYNTAKNYTLPRENEADEMGFYLMASAGFNPGGFPAAMSKMPPSPSESIFNPDDHPEQKHRWEKGLKLMSDYGYGHATVDGATVLLDGTPLFTMTADDTYSGVERACFLAGAIAKGFHDNRFSSTWFFHKEGERTDFLTDDEVYKPLKDAVNEANIAEKFEELVTTAYSNDVKIQARGKYDKTYYELRKKIKEEKQKASEPTKENISTYTEKCSKYGSMGLAGMAAYEAERLLKCNPNNELQAFAHGQLGWAAFKKGEYEKSVDEHEKALALNPNNEWNYLRLGMAHNALGNPQAALEDIENLEKSAPGKYSYSYVVKGNAYDALNDHASAKSAFAAYMLVEPNNASYVPESYRNEIASEGVETSLGTGENVGVYEYNE